MHDKIGTTFALGRRNPLLFCGAGLCVFFCFCSAAVQPQPESGSQDVVAEQPEPEETPQGSLSWAFTFGTTEDAEVRITDISIAPNGEVAVAGQIQGVVDLDPSEGISLHTGAPRDGFALRLSATSELLWVRTFGPGSFARVLAMDGLTYVTVSQRVETPPADTQGCPDAGVYGRVLRLDPSGEPEWTRTFCGAEHSPLLTAAPEQAVALVGGTYGAVDMDLGSGEDIRPVQGGNEILVAMLDVSGVMRWGGLVTGPGYLDEAMDIAVVEDGSLIVAGRFESTLDIDLGPPQRDLVGQAEVTDGFLIRYGGDGAVQWAHRLGGDEADGIVEIVALPGGQIVVLGFGDEGVDLPVGPSPSSISIGSPYLAGFDLAGTMLWSHRLEVGHSFDSRLFVFEGDVIVLTKTFEPFDGDPGPGVDQLTPPEGDSGEHIALLRFKPNGDYFRGAIIGDMPAGMVTGATSAQGRFVLGGTITRSGHIGSHALSVQRENDSFLVSFAPGQGPI